MHAERESREQLAYLVRQSVLVQPLPFPAKRYREYVRLRYICTDAFGVYMAKNVFSTCLSLAPTVSDQLATLTSILTPIKIFFCS
jgi:hypothetical protein